MSGARGKLGRGSYFLSYHRRIRFPTFFLRVSETWVFRGFPDYSSAGNTVLWWDLRPKFRTGPPPIICFDQITVVWATSRAVLSRSINTLLTNNIWLMSTLTTIISQHYFIVWPILMLCLCLPSTLFTQRQPADATSPYSKIGLSFLKSLFFIYAQKLNVIWTAATKQRKFSIHIQFTQSTSEQQCPIKITRLCIMGYF